MPGLGFSFPTDSRIGGAGTNGSSSDANGVGGIEFRERRNVKPFAVKEGMSVFAFALDIFQPGSLPEPQLVAAMLDLEAPVVARAAFLLECSYFVHRLTRGDWPAWMSFTAPGSFLSKNMYSRSSMSGRVSNSVYQRLAGRMLHSWAEVVLLLEVPMLAQTLLSLSLTGSWSEIGVFS